MNGNDGGGTRVKRDGSWISGESESYHSTYRWAGLGIMGREERKKKKMGRIDAKVPGANPPSTAPLRTFLGSPHYYTKKGFYRRPRR